MKKIIPILAVLLLSGCVSTGRYRAMQGKASEFYREWREEQVARAADVARLNTTNSSLESQLEQSNKDLLEESRELLRRGKR